jgi:hypothetical protein
MKQDRHITCNIIMRRVRAAIVCSGRALSIEYAECVLSLRCLAFNACAPYFHLWHALLYSIYPHYLINGKVSKKKLLNIKCVYLSVTSVQNFFHIKKNWARYDKNVYWSHAKYPLFFSYFSETWNFLDRFAKNTQVSNFMKFRPVGTK